MQGNVIEQIVRIDHIIWYYLNVQWHSRLGDAIIPFFRNPVFWAPLYLFLLLFMPQRFHKNGWIWCLGFLVTFALSDQVCASAMKPFFHRLRPCHNPWLNSVAHMLIDCGGEYGFPSNHASNHFALAVFTAITTSRMARWVWPVAIFWAALVAYAQVYVGAHFPLDVTVGAIVGACIGTVTGKVFNRYFRLDKQAQKAEREQNAPAL